HHPDAPRPLRLTTTEREQKAEQHLEAGGTTLKKGATASSAHDLTRGTASQKAAGDSPADASVWDAVRAPPGAQHSASFMTITARQLQALVRRRLPGSGAQDVRLLGRALEDGRGT